jgi:hypothetical protein
VRDGQRTVPSLSPSPLIKMNGATPMPAAQGPIVTDDRGMYQALRAVGACRGGVAADAWAWRIARGRPHARARRDPRLAATREAGTSVSRHLACAACTPRVFLEHGHAGGRGFA